MATAKSPETVCNAEVRVFLKMVDESAADRCRAGVDRPGT